VNTPLPSRDRARALLTAAAVRDRAHRMLALGLEDRLPSFHVDLTRLATTEDLVLQAMERSYPDGKIPFHSRWRHFRVGTEDRWAAIDRAARWKDPASRARAMIDLAVISVLLDAGAGQEWAFKDPRSGTMLRRSEGLALASLEMFAAGLFSAQPGDPLRADAEVLRRFDASTLARGFQVTPENPLTGLEGRAALMRRLGDVIAADPDRFAQVDAPRPGGLYDSLAAMAQSETISAPAILSFLLERLGPIWPSRLTLAGVALGDCWRHPSLVTDDETTELVPLHKLSQWLVYSLIEPLQEAGLTVGDIDGLTGLAEYRNGGLFVDTGVLRLRRPEDAQALHPVAAPLVVEWRALTVALIDRLAERLRLRLGLDTTSLPLPAILEGGTWAAGRAIARERRADGTPPLHVVSDGTVF
jgi:hypothetical protein